MQSAQETKYLFTRIQFTVYEIQNPLASWWARFRFWITEIVIYSNPSRLHSYVELEPRKFISNQRRSDDSPSNARILQEIIACVGRIANAWHHNCFWRKFGPDRPVRFKWENSNLQKKIVRSTAGSFWGYFWLSLIMMNFKPRPNRDSYSEAAEHGDCRQCGNNRAGHPGSVNKGWDIFSYLSLVYLSLDLSLWK